MDKNEIIVSQKNGNFKYKVIDRGETAVMVQYRHLFGKHWVAVDESRDVYTLNTIRDHELVDTPMEAAQLYVKRTRVSFNWWEYQCKLMHKNIETMLKIGGEPE